MQLSCRTSARALAWLLLVCAQQLALTRASRGRVTQAWNKPKSQDFHEHNFLHRRRESVASFHLQSAVLREIQHRFEHGTPAEIEKGNRLLQKFAPRIAHLANQDHDPEEQKQWQQLHAKVVVLGNLRAFVSPPFCHELGPALPSKTVSPLAGDLQTKTSSE